MKHDNYDTKVVSEDFIIKPTDGFGDRDLLRKTIAQVQPDALMLFTDPRFFVWVWQMEDEIHQVCPIVYWHLWDNYPWPEFNRPFYEATDLLNCINMPTYNMLKEKFPEKTNYVPHAVPKELYHPMNPDETRSIKEKLLGRERLDHFTCLYVSRNARRKMTPDVIVSWKMFIDQLQKKHGHTKATLVMHTDPMDPEGTDLHRIVDLIGVRESVVFSKDRIQFENMRVLYNIADCTINRSNAEGFGLPILETLMCGRPVIALKTGGLTHQVEDPVSGEQFGIGLNPEVKSLIGNHSVPYIYEDNVSNETVAHAIMDMYEMGPDKRAELGRKGMERAHREYNIDNVVRDWDTTLEKTIADYRTDGRFVVRTV